MPLQAGDLDRARAVGRRAAEAESAKSVSETYSSENFHV